MFRTELEPAKSKRKISIGNEVATMGSCFSDAIGNRLRHYKFSTLVNPFGTTYNPKSIHKLLHTAADNNAVPSDSFIQTGDVHANYFFHSSFSSLSRGQLEEAIQQSVNQTHDFLSNARFLIITYGTAWVYERKDSGEVVANCHKQAATLFNKRLLSQVEIVSSFKKLADRLHAFNPNLNIILTLSPVRHIKDTLELNSVSKAVLRSSIHELVSSINNVHYFPAYELMLDDLRDYRFYKSDMLHPSEEAEEYIWQKFIDCYFDTPAREFTERWREISTSLAHKPFHPQSEGHQKFLRSLLQKLNELKGSINVDSEIGYVKQQLNP